MKQTVIDLVRDRDRSNLLAVTLVFAAMAAAGSLASVLVIWCVLYILGHAAAGRQSLRPQGNDSLVLLSSLLFVLAIAASTLLGEAAGMGSILLKTAVFLFPLVLIPGLRFSAGEDLLGCALFGSAIGGCLLCVIVLGEYAVTGERVAGLSGNSGPLSVTSLITAGFALMAFGRKTGRFHDLLSLVGCFGGIAAVVLSGMRGSWPALPLCILIAFFARRHAFAQAWERVAVSRRWLVAGGLAACLALMLAIFGPLVLSRLAAVSSDVSLLGSVEGDWTSTGLRLAMYKAALSAIAERPWLGYGMQDLWPAVRAQSSSLPAYEYNHLHNVVLTIAVSAGVLGVCALAFLVAAPVWVAVRTRLLACGRDRLACTLILVLAYSISGMTNIMFFHDILDTGWVFTVSLLAASVPPIQKRALR